MIYSPNEEGQISTAHEWVGPTKPNAGDVKCVRCKVVTKIGEWQIPQCTPHRVFKSAGWKA
jgi:hypothetical protein